MDAIGWELWLGLAVWTVVVFRLGLSIGRARTALDAIEPIDPARIRPDLRVQINDILRDGRKIEAIKLLRAETGCGLAEAKKTIDAIAG